MERTHLAAVGAEPRGDGRLAEPGSPRREEDARRVGVGDPAIDLVEEPPSPGEAREVHRDVDVEGQRLQRAEEPRLNALRLHTIVLQRVEQRFEAGGVAIGAGCRVGGVA